MPQMTPVQSRLKALDYLSSRFKQLGEAHKTLGETKKEFDLLTSKGDSVTEDDLVKAAAQMVGLGADPNKIASMLSGSPSGGSQLAQWVSKQDQALQQTQAKVLQAREQARGALTQGIFGHLAKTVMEQMPAPSPQQIGHAVANSPQAPAPALPPNPMMGGQ